MKNFVSIDRKIPLFSDEGYCGSFSGDYINAVWNDHAQKARAYINSPDFPYSHNYCIIYGFKEYTEAVVLAKVTLTKSINPTAFVTHLHTSDSPEAENTRYIFGIAYRTRGTR